MKPNHEGKRPVLIPNCLFSWPTELALRAEANPPQTKFATVQAVPFVAAVPVPDSERV